MAEAAETQWYYVRNAQQNGPIIESVLRQLLATGQLSPSDMVWREGLDAWRPVSSLSELRSRDRGTPPPLPGAPGLAGYPAASIPYATPIPAEGGLGQDAAMRWLLPVGRSGWAIAAGYLGLFSVLMFPAPIALLISILAIRDLKRHPTRRGLGRVIFGLVMGLLGTAMLLLLVVNVVLRRA